MKMPYFIVYIRTPQPFLYAICWDSAFHLESLCFNMLANSHDPDQAAPKEQSGQGLHLLPRQLSQNLWSGLRINKCCI